MVTMNEAAKVGILHEERTPDYSGIACFFIYASLLAGAILVMLFVGLPLGFVPDAFDKILFFSIVSLIVCLFVASFLSKFPDFRLRITADRVYVSGDETIVVPIKNIVSVSSSAPHKVTLHTSSGFVDLCHVRDVFQVVQKLDALIGQHSEAVPSDDFDPLAILSRQASNATHRPHNLAGGSTEKQQIYYQFIGGEMDISVFSREEASSMIQSELDKLSFGISTACPYCGHTTTAKSTRNRKCKKCGKMMVFYHGAYWSESDAKKIKNPMVSQQFESDEERERRERKEYCQFLRGRIREEVSDILEGAREIYQIMKSPEDRLVGYIVEVEDGTSCQHTNLFRQVVFLACVTTEQTLKNLPPYKDCPTGCECCVLRSVESHDVTGRRPALWDGIKKRPTIPSYIADISLELR